MKFSLFIHMERVSADQDQKTLYEEMLELCRIADEGGLHAIWTGEHHAMNFTISPNPFLNLIDIARQTKNVRLGTGTVVAPFWHPIRLAGEAAMTDLITGGRLELGIARGAYSFEYERMLPGLDAWGAGQRMRELIPAIKKVWQGDYEHQGDFWQFPKTTSAPLPVQKPHPPIWVAARDPNSHEFAVENGCNVQVTPLHLGDEEVESLMERFNAACEKFPDQPRPQIMVLRHTYVADSEADAQRGAEELNLFYNYFGAWFKNERPISMGLIERLTPEDVAAHPFYSPEAMRRNQIVGEAPEVIARIKSYEALGYDEFSFWIDSGMSFERKRASLERFIRDVIPAFG
ncbi:alkanesulfonate monooxygenase SsuD/methylene tetrahydromethanopterin reductase-like flavin-dependent oxidoreductase (luciferase family) [Pseudochelatococcus lubricantis]|uniref:Alkanesulfonate monooxygenase SsuD/methylene tetrahydromethanopterin reductase-like flavin-dependent oxidoreductase (Luciferase family) n=1 Tax=Pseudochelatococcus lubricantis TaxID=1538102 RepID=A0ABX0V0T4_9HYPH|nr:LLM class flavin-dependent oxidoreductase [Pseudochelatococcus lubricantis]NIJ58763.1 alkanesulfonate monooxygenase SsuD/methylene tetrahydromethanopterin reductase-like flavin-dependent oxidoreductase (luciferase family) [Pseudochelatococcus lubricantis]